MTIEEARALIPPGWVECDGYAYGSACYDDRSRLAIGPCSNGTVYAVLDENAIPAPKPEPRRAEVVVELDEDGVSKNYAHVTGLIRDWVGGSAFNCDAVANSKFRITIEEELSK